MKFILFFIDGVGIGTDDPSVNPFSRFQASILRIFSGTELPGRLPFGGFYKGVDAGLGMIGRPQSATGQTAILTGTNASHQLGYHLNGFPNQHLRKILMEGSLLRILKSRSYRVDFINTYRPPFFTMTPEERLKKASCSTLSALAADLSFHSIDDLVQKKSICHDLTNETFIQQGFDAPTWGADTSAQILLKTLESLDLVMFEFFMTDFAGHWQDWNLAQILLNRLELFLKTILSLMNPQDTTLIMISDHGNFEDLSIKSHTLNPALLAAWGNLASDFVESCQNIMDPYHKILNILHKKSAY